MGERTDADDVDPGRRDVGDGVERDAAAGLDDRPAADHLDAGTQLVEVEVVEHDRVDLAGGQHRLDLVEPVDLDLDVRRVRKLSAAGPDGRGDVVDEGQVVVLGHHGVGEREPVVVAAAADDGVTFERPQPRGGLAGVDDAGLRARDRLDVPGGQRGDAAHPLQRG